MDKLSKWSPWLLGFTVALFATPGVLLLLLKEQWGAAFLVVVSILYAVGLGWSTLWRRLGRPPIPAAARKQ